MTDNLGGDLLRKPRIRLGVACMPAFRSYSAPLLMQDVSINIGIDASPPVAVARVVVLLVIAQGDGAPKVQRRLFPMLRIGIGLRAAIG